jgi:hypothetical protein
MRHKHATYYGGRTPLGFWIESAFIALIALAFIAALLAMVAYAHAQPVSSIDIRVIDGDTIALSGLRQHVRLVGFNAPETRNAGCEAEAQLGRRAKQRLQALVDTGSLELTRLFIEASLSQSSSLCIMRSVLSVYNFASCSRCVVVGFRRSLCCHADLLAHAPGKPRVKALKAKGRKR